MSSSTKLTQKFHPQIKRQLKRLHPFDHTKIITIFERLDTHPFPKNLTGTQNFYRIRTGQIRLIYELNLENKVVYIWKLGFRQNFY